MSDEAICRRSSADFGAVIWPPNAGAFAKRSFK